jgi:hypothetical protein
MIGNKTGARGEEAMAGHMIDPFDGCINIRAIKYPLTGVLYHIKY